MMHYYTYYRDFWDNCLLSDGTDKFPTKKTRPAPVKPVTRPVKACMHRKTLCGRNH